MKSSILKHKKSLTWMLVILLSIFSFDAHSQYVIKAADQQYELYNYSEAVKLYLKAWKKKEKPYTAERIGESYRRMNDYQSAEQWYGRLSGMAGSNPDSRLWQAEALKSLGMYTAAKTAYQQYTGGTATPAQIQTWISACDSAMAWIAAPKPFKIENEAKLNSGGSDWGAVKYADGVVFTSDRSSALIAEAAKGRPFLKFDGTRLPDKQIYRWTGSPYEHLYYSKGDQISLFPLAVGNDYHTAAVSFTADGKEAYFTMTNVKDKKKLDKTLNTIYIGLYSSRYEDGKWTAPKAFRYTDMTKWSVGDPCIAADGQTLYFVSDMPGGQGGTDIYKSSRKTDGTWSDAVNLGPAVNTTGNERSPAVYNDLLYFSSDGLIGMGGLDIFKIALSNVQNGKAVNVGYPMNSAQDDFATSLTGASSGFISSNRMNGAGSDDIYAFTLLPEKPAEVVLVTPIAPVLAVVAVKKRDSIYVENIYYNFDKANIRRDASVVLNKVYDLMLQNPSSNLVLSSHTDSKGTTAYNLRLSRQRAAAAVKYLTEKGIERSRMEADGFGESRPVAPNSLNGKDNPEGRQLNRRTEIKLFL
ncbi:OmpA family protein [Pedobacter hiemivivus]|uniref:Flagellar motor protein MotB n=1 Tax=Pedobacter hiemivivus TaxID=2530454 RepID=A0A4R0MMB9_9SPHI|nr:OmpA family protein [Pedobacter hiemivivus]TCC87868.1 flagellar motor protein MotB [Pedobacter hiemivivus]